LAKKISSTNCGLQTFGDILHVNIIYKLVHEHTIIVLTGKIKSRCGGERKRERERDKHGHRYKGRERERETVVRGKGRGGWPWREIVREEEERR
jgi:hypothetical protein